MEKCAQKGFDRAGILRDGCITRNRRLESGNPTSMISLCQEAKPLLTRSGGAREKVFQGLSARDYCLSAVVLAFQQNQTSICCLSHEWPPQKIELVISCQSRNNTTGASGACTPSLSRIRARPGRPQAEESRLFSRQPL